MSLWWASRDQLDATQRTLIEDLPLRENHLILGPPGSGKTNVLLRRAQFVRSQNMPNVMVLTFTRALTEFVKTGCHNAQGQEIFPRACVNTIEGWIRSLYSAHNTALPNNGSQLSLSEWKAQLATGAMAFPAMGRMPRYDAIFVDEAQDLMAEEVALLRSWANNLFFVGDDRQKVYDHTRGLEVVRALVPPPNESVLPFHYRLAAEISAMADKILVTEGGASLEATSHYRGPRPGRIRTHGPLARVTQVEQAIAALQGQLRVYNDLIQQGDRLGVIVPKKDDRTYVWEALERDPALSGRVQVVRARSGDVDDDYDPTFDPERPISVLTEHASKGLEFRAVQWLFADSLAHRRRAENYYTVVTRAKTTLDIYHDGDLPGVLARAYSPPVDDLW